MDYGFIIGVSSSKHILIRTGTGEDLSRAGITSIDLGTPVPTEKHFSLQLSRVSGVAVIDDVAISDSSDRLAWIVVTGPCKSSLCISGLHGEDMHELGRINWLSEPSATSSNLKINYWPQAIRWLPDGKRISFVLKNELYVLDVD